MGALNEKGLESLVNELKPSVVRQMTKAEFDALSEEDRQGLIWTTDEDPSSGPSSGMSVSNVYSYEKKVVGKWHDGRPVYQQTFLVTGKIKAGQGFVGISEHPAGSFMIASEGYFWRFHDNEPQYESYLFTFPYTQTSTNGTNVIVLTIGSTVNQTGYSTWFAYQLDFESTYKAEITLKFVEGEEGGVS